MKKILATEAATEPQIVALTFDIIDDEGGGWNYNGAVNVLSASMDCAYLSDINGSTVIVRCWTHYSYVGMPDVYDNRKMTQNPARVFRPIEMTVSPDCDLDWDIVGIQGQEQVIVRNLPAELIATVADIYDRPVQIRVTPCFGCHHVRRMKGSHHYSVVIGWQIAEPYYSVHDGLSALLSGEPGYPINSMKIVPKRNVEVEVAELFGFCSTSEDSDACDGYMFISEKPPLAVSLKNFVVHREESICPFCRSW